MRSVTMRNNLLRSDLQYAVKKSARLVKAMDRAKSDQGQSCATVSPSLRHQ